MTDSTPDNPQPVDLEKRDAVNEITDQPDAYEDDPYIYSKKDVVFSCAITGIIVCLMTILGAILVVHKIQHNSGADAYMGGFSSPYVIGYAPESQDQINLEDNTPYYDNSTMTSTTVNVVDVICATTVDVSSTDVSNGATVSIPGLQLDATAQQVKSLIVGRVYSLTYSDETVIQSNYGSSDSTTEQLTLTHVGKAPQGSAPVSDTSMC